MLRVDGSIVDGMGMWFVNLLMVDEVLECDEQL